MNRKVLLYYCLCSAFSTALLTRQAFAEKADYTSDYELIEITEEEAKNLPNAVVKYKEDEVTREIIPQYYKLELKQTTYGSGGDTTENFEWKKDDKSGNYDFVTPEDPADADITANYDKGKNQRENNPGKKEIDHDFVGLHSGEGAGGAVNNGWISKDVVLEGDFIGNSATKEETKEEEKSYVSGGAVNNNVESSITSITGDFVGNFITSPDVSQGGAIFNGANYNDSPIASSIGAITGNFIGNYAVAENDYSQGGAIANMSGKITSVTGDFIGNYTSSGKEAHGGAIINYDNGTIDGGITGDFIDNYAYSATGSADGGAIKNDGYHNGSGHGKASIGHIQGDFIQNHAKGKIFASGGAVFNENGAKINSITGDFIGDYTWSEQDRITDDSSNAISSDSTSSGLGAQGGAVYNFEDSEIGNITGTFAANYAHSKEGQAHGGAIYNYSNSKLGNITGDFLLNSATGKTIAHGGAIDNANSTIGNIDGDFIGNYAEGSQDVYGGAIFNYNNGKIGDIKGSFVGNTASSVSGKAYGGAIYNDGGKFGNIEGNFYLNVAEGAEGNGGAIANNGVISSVHGDFMGNKASQNGGAIYNAKSEKTEKSEEEGKNDAEKKGIYNANFYDNIAENGHGGAIYTAADLQITADAVTSEFAGNKAGVEDEAIYAKSGAKLSLMTKNSGQFNFFDAINGEKGYTLDLSGDSSGVVNFYSNISNADIVHNAVTTNVFDAENLNQSNSLTMNSGTLNLYRLGMTNLKFGKFSMNDGEINIGSVDVDLAHQQMGRISADDYEESTGGNIYVKNMNVVSDSDQLQTSVNFADETFAKNVSSPVKEAYGKVYKYAVDYLSEADLSDVGAVGDFLFTRIGYNPAVLASPVAAQVGGYLAQIDTYDEAFRNMDMYMLTDKTKPGTPQCPGCQGTALYDGIVAKNASNTAWIRPYSRFEDVSLRQGFDVSQDVYGLFGGIESPMNYLGYCWDAIGSIYGGYVESHQKYDDVKIRQKGGVLGVVGMLYRVNFFTGMTVNFGQSQAKARTFSGHETFDMYTTGIASKTGYNMPFSHGKFIVQPNFVMSYSYVDVPDYTNAQGVKIRSKPISAVQLEPGLKLIANIGSGWQPYVGASYVRNLHDKTYFKADGFKLPEFETKAFMKYKLGLRKTFNDNSVGYIQFDAVDIGREGYAGLAGLRISF